MADLTLDELISILSDIRESVGRGDIPVCADVNMGEYEVEFEGARYLPDRTRVMLWDSPWSDYAPRSYDAR